MLSKSGKGDYLCLVPDLMGNNLIFTNKNDLAMGFYR